MLPVDFRNYDDPSMVEVADYQFKVVIKTSLGFFTFFVVRKSAPLFEYIDNFLLSNGIPEDSLLSVHIYLCKLYL